MREEARGLEEERRGARATIGASGCGAQVGDFSEPRAFGHHALLGGTKEAGSMEHRAGTALGVSGGKGPRPLPAAAGRNRSINRIANELPEPGERKRLDSAAGMDVIVRPLLLSEHGRCGAIGQAVF